MRVIAGRLKGRLLKAPKSTLVRPTADRVKEALFSILGSQVVGARVLDLYAGTGALGIEALSRGAAAVTFVEANPTTVHMLRTNLHMCGVADQADVRSCRVETFLARVPDRTEPYQVVLADPPYQQTPEVEGWATRLAENLLASNAVAVLEHARKWIPLPVLGGLGLVRTYLYGDTALSVYRPTLPEAHA